MTYANLVTIDLLACVSLCLSPSLSLLVFVSIEPNNCRFARNKPLDRSMCFSCSLVRQSIVVVFASVTFNDLIRHGFTNGIWQNMFGVSRWHTLSQWIQLDWRQKTEQRNVFSWQPRMVLFYSYKHTKNNSSVSIPVNKDPLSKLSQ